MLTHAGGVSSGVQCAHCDGAPTDRCAVAPYGGSGTVGMAWAWRHMGGAGIGEVLGLPEGSFLENIANGQELPGKKLLWAERAKAYFGGEAMRVGNVSSYRT